MSKTTPLRLRMTHHLGHGHGARTTSNIVLHQEHQLSSYTSAGFQIGTLLTDRCEGGVIAIATLIQSKGIAINPSSAGKHVPVIENDIKTTNSCTTVQIVLDTACVACAILCQLCQHGAIVNNL